MSATSADLLFTPIPARINRLRDIAYNYWWAWNPTATDLFNRIDFQLWESIYHNPVQFLRNVRQRNLIAAANNPTWLADYDAVVVGFDAYMNRKNTWFKRTYPTEKSTIAYFSAEFGLHESLPIYSGGLGILAGDHIKEASDLDLPLVAVGFIYPQGYFRQRLDHSGWQEALYSKMSFADIPARPALTPDGNEVVVEVDLPGRTIYAKVYHLQVGRMVLYLLDTDIHPNSPADRDLSARLYGGDHELRVAQELVLGVGGVRALRQLGIAPTVWHMNEGHSAFLVLELAREYVANGVPFMQAFDMVRDQAVFTTHTPVPAGNDAFSLDLIDKYFSQFWDLLGISRDAFMNIAMQQQSWGPSFAMTVLALRLSDMHNGVSKLHGQVARSMWQWLYPGKSNDEVPITSVTNGIHTASWIAPTMRYLFDRTLDPDWYEHLDNPATWQALKSSDDSEFWQARLSLKRTLVEFVRERVAPRHTRLGFPPVAWPMFDDTILTIGFARRFATYKRATLLFKDADRLKAILNNPARPIQMVFAGKAHPADEPGKHFIQDVYRRSQEPGFAGRIIFLEEYDMCVARALVQGVDVWLNTPRRPYEASGTSGQKASLNGIPNLSILDGWWPEAYDGTNGWAIGSEQANDNLDAQDWDDAQHLYHLLETEVAPAYYDRDAHGVSAHWVAIAKAAVMTCAPKFSTQRMLKEYVNLLYLKRSK
ncbi:MAG: alpha-glucan family phosphorylase [Chloroflexales bacterium]|nr:alpha-glucan family phosphorylase [Chloroflexales bacterium]